MRKALFILYLVFGSVFGAFAQSNYPIYVAPTLIPPYSLKLSDYSKFGSQQLIVNIVVNDLNVANLPVKLRVKLETVGVTIENPPTINTTPIYLDGGATIVLSGDDLKDYFDINNLIFKGYGKEAYKRSGQLPEGFYKITVEVLHFQTNRLISNQGSASAWIALGKPPILKLPENNKEMGEFKGMPIVFSWLPSNVGSPISANSIQYKFEMWEMRVDGISPYVIASSVPVFHDETTQSTNISLIPSSLLMEPGMKYAWRITASDLSGFVPFEQDGHSEIRVFTYKSKCDSVTNLSAANIAKNGIFKWAPRENHTSFNVEMRNPVTGWSLNSQTYDSKAEFSDLDYGTKYEMRVQAVCDGDPESVSDFSQWKAVVIPQKRVNADSTACPNCKCDDNLGAGNVENIELRKDMKPGDTIVNRYGTTRFIVKSVEPQGDGVYKGQFLFCAELWKLKFICNYWDLSVNTNNVIVNMDYESVYNPQYLLDVDATTAYLDKLAGDITTLTVNADIKDTISVNETITSIYVNAGDSLIAVTVGPDGQLHEVVIQTDAKDIEKTMVEGENGEEYVVNRDGEVMGVKEYQNSGGGNNRMMNDYIAKNESEHLSSTTEVKFSASPNQKFGFDAFSSEKQTLAGEYPSLQNGYQPAYKSMASFSPDRVNISSAGNGITFRDEMGIPAIASGNELTVRGGTDGATTALYAYKALNDSTEEIAGKLNIMSYDEQVKKVYIIPVNKAKVPGEAALQKTLNTIYGQAVTRWEVTKIDKGLTVTFENGKMTHGGSNAIAVYNTDQKSIISKFKETDDFENDALYLFFVDNVQSKTDDIAGFMPLQRQVGFIYDNPNEYIIAHELAHGAFNLRHTFSPEKLIAQKGTTKNLMDYNSGTELWKHQWDYIHDPQNMMFAWAQGEEEGEMSSGTDFFVLDINGVKFKYYSLKGLDDILSSGGSPNENEMYVYFFGEKIDKITIKAGIFSEKNNKFKVSSVIWQEVNRMDVVLRNIGGGETEPSESFTEETIVDDKRYRFTLERTVGQMNFKIPFYVHFLASYPLVYNSTTTVQNVSEKLIESSTFSAYGSDKLDLRAEVISYKDYVFLKENPKNKQYITPITRNNGGISSIKFNETEYINDPLTLKTFDLKPNNAENTYQIIPLIGNPFTLTINPSANKEPVILFSKAEEALNKYGYDDMGLGEKSATDHHISVKEFDNTHIKVNFENLTDISTISFKAENSNIKLSIPDQVVGTSFNLEILANTISLPNPVKIEAVYTNKTDNSSKVLGNFYLHVYKEITIEADIYYMTENVPKKSEIEEGANKLLKYAVLKLDVKGVTPLSATFDHNKNGILDMYQNVPDANDDEFKSLCSSLSNSSLKKNIIVIDAVEASYRLSASINAGDVEISLPRTTGFNLYGYYTIFDPVNNTSEAFLVEAIDAERKKIKVRLVEPSSVSLGYTPVKPEENGFKNSYMINTDNGKNVYITVGPLGGISSTPVIVGSSNLIVVIPHERLHHLKYSDVGFDESNLMDCLAAPPTMKYPLRCLPIQPVKTGCHEAVGDKQKQWDLIDRTKFIQ